VPEPREESFDQPLTPEEPTGVALAERMQASVRIDHLSIDRRGGRLFFPRRHVQGLDERLDGVEPLFGSNGRGVREDFGHGGRDRR
jgi:hypothetical protein